MNLGRYQRGQWMLLDLVARDPSGNPAVPDSAPTITITGPAGFEPAVLPMVADRKACRINGVGTSFARPIFFGFPFLLGIYTVEYSVSVGGVVSSSSDTFQVVGGGDIGGRPISMFAYDRPEATYIVAQLDSGNVVQGKNPRL